MFSKLLYPFSILYEYLLNLDKNLSIQNKLPKPVISVGNITWGGTGKTPIVAELANNLIKSGFKVGILSRGYKRKDSKDNILIVSDGKDMLSEPYKSGDEPYLLSRLVPNAIISVSKDRYLAGLKLINEYAVDVLILDDGFQYWKLKRDLDIVCINALNAFGNGKLIPAGILRERLSSLARAHMILINNVDLITEEKLKKIEDKINAFNPSPPIYFCYVPIGLRRIYDQHFISLSDFYEKNIIAFSGLGNNIGFNRTLINFGFNLVAHYKFYDHHWYSLNDLLNIFKSNTSYLPVITSSKDAIRILDVIQLLPKDKMKYLYQLEVGIKILKGKERWEKIPANIRRSF